jgi:hypothetical protein
MAQNLGLAHTGREHAQRFKGQFFTTILDSASLKARMGSIEPAVRSLMNCFPLSGIAVVGCLRIPQNPCKQPQASCDAKDRYPFHSTPPPFAAPAARF